MDLKRLNIANLKNPFQRGTQKSEAHTESATSDELNGLKTANQPANRSVTENVAFLWNKMKTGSVYFYFVLT